MSQEPETVDPSFDSVRLRVWYGSVPVRIIYGDDQLDFNVPRLSYLPLLKPKIVHHWKLTWSTINFLCDGKPVNTSLPAGLLYDLHHARILVLQAICGKELDIEGRIWNSLKQATTIKYGNIRSLQDLTPSQTRSLLDSMLILDFVPYFELVRTALKIRHIPVRLYLNESITIQGLVNTGSTLAEALSILVPRVAFLEQQIVQIILHGIPVSWSTSMDELLEEAAYVDGWLYLTLLANTEDMKLALSSESAEIP